MAIETEQEDIIAEIQDRINILTKDGKQEMVEAGGNLGNALWKNSLGVIASWFFINAPGRFHTPVSDGEVWIWIGSAAVAGISVYSGFQDIFRGVHHIRSHNAIMGEVLSHRAAISRRFENLLHNN